MRCLFFLLFAFSTASAQQLTIAADKMNVCYLGVDNPLSAAAFGCDARRLVLKTENGAIARDTGSGFVYRPARAGVTEIAAYCVKGKDSMLVGKVPFRVKYLPKPRVHMNQDHYTHFGKTPFRATAIVAILEGFDFNAQFIITGFDCSRKSKSGEVSGTLHSTTGAFTPEMTALIKSSYPGDRLYLDNIRCRTPDGRELDLGSITEIL